MRLVDRYCASHRLDDSRVYLTGISQGSIGAWNLASTPRYATRFAAVAPVSGGLVFREMTQRAAYLVDTPIWAFHAVNDRILDVGMCDRSVATCNATDRRQPLRYTRLEWAPPRDYSWSASGIQDETGHVSWNYAYYPSDRPVGDVPLYDWFLRHTRPQRGPRRRPPPFDETATIARVGRGRRPGRGA